MLSVFYSNLRFHQTLFGLCGNACLIETIDLLAQKAYGIRFYANAFAKSLDLARRLPHLPFRLSRAMLDNGLTYANSDAASASAHRTASPQRLNGAGASPTRAPMIGPTSIPSPNVVASWSHSPAQRSRNAIAASARPRSPARPAARPGAA